MLRRTQFSPIEGKLDIGSNVIIGFGANIRAAGGVITIGDNCLIAQNVSLIAANHKISLDKPFRDLPWDTIRKGIVLGKNVWIGANSVILPGIKIGDNAVIGAGSVVTKNVPSNEVWAGNPACHIRRIQRSEN